MNWTDFFNMGGYAFHVWTSWGLSLGALVVIVILSKFNNAKIKAELLRQIERERKLDSNQ
ncbi:heme exporter protein CcmD [Arenicella sp. 4NH20-0111]|uniref:heme exporter protein CcmD n=1 Tax=Arenicella sp. 4NH20-0111 TaxID=3127648 RepID=UPI0031087126